MGNRCSRCVSLKADEVGSEHKQRHEKLGCLWRPAQKPRLKKKKIGKGVGHEARIASVVDTWSCSYLRPTAVCLRLTQQAPPYGPCAA